eukprot:tig00000842_g4878.t1
MRIEVASRAAVVVRVRPSVQEDVENRKAGPYQECIRVVPGANRLVLFRQFYEDREFAFDTVLGPEVSQEEAYDAIARDIVQDILSGFNGTIMAYGQTGTGKTHTIFGPAALWNQQAGRAGPQEGMGQDWFRMCGVLPRSVVAIFDYIARVREGVPGAQVSVTLQFFQIYLEVITDLLEPSGRALAIREDPRQGVFVEGLTAVPVRSASEFMRLIAAGARMRATSSTSMNKTSSRSHVIMYITVEQALPSRAEVGVVKVKRATLTVVDLAGSERVSKSGSEGLRLEEAKKINKSIAALGNCVAALSDAGRAGAGLGHVPFRESKLTRLLTDSLGGNSKTVLCGNVGPAAFNFDETFTTLLFATRAMAVKNHVYVNESLAGRQRGGAGPVSEGNGVDSEKVELLERNSSLEREVALLRGQLDHIRSSSSLAPERDEAGALEHARPPRERRASGAANGLELRLAYKLRQSEERADALAREISGLRDALVKAGVRAHEEAPEEAARRAPSARPRWGDEEAAPRRLLDPAMPYVEELPPSRPHSAIHFGRERRGGSRGDEYARGHREEYGGGREMYEHEEDWGGRTRGSRRSSGGHEGSPPLAWHGAREGGRPRSKGAPAAATRATPNPAAAARSPRRAAPPHPGPGPRGPAPAPAAPPPRRRRRRPCRRRRRRRRARGAGGERGEIRAEVRAEFEERVERLEATILQQRIDFDRARREWEEERAALARRVRTGPPPAPSRPTRAPRSSPRPRPPPPAGRCRGGVSGAAARAAAAAAEAAAGAGGGALEELVGALFGIPRLRDRLIEEFVMVAEASQAEEDEAGAPEPHASPGP